MNYNREKVLEVSKILIVESHNDKFFIEALVKHMNSSDITIETPICMIDDYECLTSLSQLESRLIALRADIEKHADIDKIGIIVDADKVGVQSRTDEVQIIVDKLFTDLDIEVSIYIMNVDGQGELETVLKQIASSDTTIADCLESWQECIEEKKKLNQKEFDKVWVQMYQRYDCCTKNEARQAGKKCNNEISFSKNIYDLDNPILDKLKTFLQELGAN